MSGMLLLEGKQRVLRSIMICLFFQKSSFDLHERSVEESFAQSKQQFVARDFHHGKQRVSPFYHVSHPIHEKNVFRSPENGMLLARDWFHGKQRFSPFNHGSGFGFGWLEWELGLLHNLSIWSLSNF